MHAECFVYLIGSEGLAPSCKIGITKNPDDRVKSLQCGNPNLLWVKKAWIFDSRQYAEFVERSLHCALSSLRLQGEWFAVDCDDAVEVIDWVICRLSKQDIDPNLLMTTADEMMDDILIGEGDR